MFKLTEYGGSFKSAKVQDIATFSSEQPWDINLIQGRNITFLHVQLMVAYSVPGGGAEPASPIEDGLAKLVQNIALNWGGGQGTPIEYADMQQGMLYAQHVANGSMRNDQPAIPTAGGDQEVGYVDMVILPSLNHNDIQDPRFAIPGEAPDVENIKLNGKWGSVQNLFGTPNDVVIDSAQVTVTNQSAWMFGAGGDIQNALGVDGSGNLWLPLYNKGTKDISQTTTSLGLDIALPTDVIIRRIFLVLKDSNDERSDDVLDDFALQTSANENLIGELDFSAFQRAKAGRLDISPYPGTLMLDMKEDVRDPSYAGNKKGLVLNKSDKLNFKFSANQTGRVDFLFDTIRKHKLFA